MSQMLANLSQDDPYTFQGALAPYPVFTLRNGLTVALAPHVSMGQLAAALGTSLMLHDLHPQLVILGGIAGCIEHEKDGLVHGDVIVSDQIVDYELEKIREDRREIRARDFQSSRGVRHHLSKALESWKPLASDLPSRPDGLRRVSRAVTGSVFSGNKVLANSTERDVLRALRPTVVAIEMEAAGVAAMLEQMRILDRFVMIKSITDLADQNKGDAWHEYACAASASCIGYLLMNTLPAYLDSLSTIDRDKKLRLQRSAQHALKSFLASQTSTVPAFEAVAQDMLKRTLDEIASLASVAQSEEATYQGRVGIGDNYLLRAGPLFRRATRIFATSLDSVSTFWMDRRNRRKVRDFIRSHAEAVDRANVMRLFVFSKPHNAHDHAIRLDYHAEHFENTFVCSRKQYVNLLKVLAPDTGDKYLSRDFAIIDCSTSQGSSTFFADLDDDSLSLNRALYDHPAAEVDCAKTIALFQELAALAPGELSSKHHVLKWQPEHWRTAVWPLNLETMFAEQTAGVFHMVAFNVTDQDYGELRSLLADIKYQILDGTPNSPGALATRHGIRDVRIFKQIDQEGRLVDPVSKGLIHYKSHPEMRYILLMQFAQKDRLTHFMIDREHLRMRLDLFKRLGGEIASAIQELQVDTPEVLEQAKTSKEIYERLEFLAADRMSRHDFVDDELISEMVRKTPPQL